MGSWEKRCDLVGSRFKFFKKNQNSIVSAQRELGGDREEFYNFLKVSSPLPLSMPKLKSDIPPTPSKIHRVQKNFHFIMELWRVLEPSVCKFEKAVPQG